MNPALIFLMAGAMNEKVGRHVDLFQTLDFRAHSGEQLTWKIECDALSTAEWDTLAAMIYEYEPQRFGMNPYERLMAKKVTDDRDSDTA